jgi:hypothetical protein
MPPTLRGGHTARRILSHGNGGFSHDSAVCRDVYRHIARMAHPDKNPMRDAYHCAVAGIVMDAAQRASGIVASSSSSDRDAFHLLPALDSTQFVAMVDAHRLAKIGYTPPGRSSATPSTPRGSATPVPTGHHPPTMPRIPPFSWPGSAEPFSLEPHILSATDAFPDGTLAQLRSQPMGESNFSGIEDEGSSDYSAFHFSAPAALADDPAVVPATTAATAAGRPSASLLNTYRRRCHLRMAEAGAPARAHNEPITAVPDGRVPSGASRFHRGSTVA